MGRTRPLYQALLLTTALVGCGESAIKEGVYSVALSIEKSSCGGDDADVVWALAQLETGAWFLDELETPFLMEGIGAGSDLVFDLLEVVPADPANVFSCEVTRHHEVHLQPADDGFEGRYDFTGTAPCLPAEEQVCHRTYEAKGKPRS